MINFKIRSADDEDPKFDENERSYLSKLSGDVLSMEHLPDFYKYFGNDFFHDGEIRELHFTDNFQGLSFEVSCPNIKINESYCRPIWFRCSFSGIGYFEMSANKIDDFNDPLCVKEQKIRFLQSEINSMNEELNRYNSMYDDTFNSIIIKLLPINRCVSFVFTTIDIAPIEPLAFECICRNPDFKIPFFFCPSKTDSIST